MSLRWPNKDKDETLDFSIDWSRFLSGSEILSSVAWKIKDADGEKVDFDPSTTVNGLTLQTQSNTTTVATVYLQDGTDNTQYTLYCNITTSTGRVAERPVKIRIREYN
jgi:hypothetical protein